jgi:hypothetical protein
VLGGIVRNSLILLTLRIEVKNSSRQSQEVRRLFEFQFLKIHEN